MHSFRAMIVFVFSMALMASVAYAKPARHHTAGAHAQSAHKGKKKTAVKAVKRLHGQQGIQPERAMEIQQALVREHYLSSEPSGRWDADTIAAMQKYQADNGWQTKLMPDSRALKKLGLGPDYSNAINAKTGAFGAPPPESTIPATQAAGFALGSGVNR